MNMSEGSSDASCTPKATTTVPVASSSSSSSYLWSSDPTQTPSSDRIVATKMQKGFEDILVQTGTGLVLGFLAGVVLAHGGGSPRARKLFAGLGAGIGLGSSWTKTSMELEDLLSSWSMSNSPKK